MNTPAMAAHAQALHAQACDALRHNGIAVLHAAIDVAMQELIGFRLLTVLRLDGLRLVRAYSSNSVAYPAGGSKDIRNDTWLRETLQAGVPVITSTDEQLRTRFVDHDAIRALGCGGVLNVPVVADGSTLGYLNLLHVTGWFTPAHAALAQPFAQLPAQAWLAGRPDRNDPAS